MIHQLTQTYQNDSHFNLNKHLAFKFFYLASLYPETEDEANLKLADYYYYGIACDQSYEGALIKYKQVTARSKDEELIGQAYLSMGMIYHFGKGTGQDLELAQTYYERAMKVDSKALAPVYMLSLYGKWQKLDIVDTMIKFAGDELQEYP